MLRIADLTAEGRLEELHEVVPGVLGLLLVIDVMVLHAPAVMRAFIDLTGIGFVPA